MTSVILPVAWFVFLSSPNSPDRLWHYLAIFSFVGLIEGCTNTGRHVARGNKFARGVKIFMALQYRTYIISPFCRLESWGGSWICWNICATLAECNFLFITERLMFRFSLQSLIAVAMVISGTIDSLIDFFSFTAWIFYGGSMLALIVMRFTKPNAPRPYKVRTILNFFRHSHELSRKLHIGVPHPLGVCGPLFDLINLPRIPYTSTCISGLCYWLRYISWSLILKYSTFRPHSVFVCLI